MTTSPFSSPACSAGVSGQTSSISAPVAVGPTGDDLGADDRVARLAGAQDLVGGDPDLLDRDREPDADVARLALTAPPVVAIARVDADHLAAAGSPAGRRSCRG